MTSYCYSVYLNDVIVSVYQITVIIIIMHTKIMS